MMGNCREVERAAQPSRGSGSQGELKRSTKAELSTNSFIGAFCLLVCCFLPPRKKIHSAGTCKI